MYSCLNQSIQYQPANQSESSRNLSIFIAFKKAAQSYKIRKSVNPEVLAKTYKTLSDNASVMLQGKNNINSPNKSDTSSLSSIFKEINTLPKKDEPFAYKKSRNSL